jgi:hypothetical protein
MHIKNFILWLTIFSSYPALAYNFAECILDKLPGSSNQATHGAVFNICREKSNEKYTEILKGSGRGFFGHADGNSCVLKKAKETSYQLSAMQIAFACRCLYDPPEYNGQTCINPFSDINFGK